MPEQPPPQPSIPPFLVHLTTLQRRTEIPLCLSTVDSNTPMSVEAFNQLRSHQTVHQHQVCAVEKHMDLVATQSNPGLQCGWDSQQSQTYHQGCRPDSPIQGS